MVTTMYNNHEYSDCFEYPNQATKKNTCQNFPSHKNPKTENFKPKKILRLSLSLEIRRTPLWLTWGPSSQRKQALSVIWHNH